MCTESRRSYPKTVVSCNRRKIVKIESPQNTLLPSSLQGPRHSDRNAWAGAESWSSMACLKLVHVLLLACSLPTNDTASAQQLATMFVPVAKDACSCCIRGYHAALAAARCVATHGRRPPLEPAPFPCASMCRMPGDCMGGQLVLGTRI